MDTFSSIFSLTSVYAPNFEEVEEAYWFGPVRLSVDLSVVLSVRLSVMLALGQEPLQIGSCKLVCGMSMEIKKIHFFSRPSDLSLQTYCPIPSVFVFVFVCLLHSEPMKACGQNISRTT